MTAEEAISWADRTVGHCRASDKPVYCPSCDALVALVSEIRRLALLNEDKHRTIQAYCKAASEDRAEVRRLWWIIEEYATEYGKAEMREDEKKEDAK